MSLIKPTKLKFLRESQLNPAFYKAMWNASAQFRGTFYESKDWRETSLSYSDRRAMLQGCYFQ